jgi:hypothetical protein
MGVVSKNDVGDRKTPLKAALNIPRLATKLASLITRTVVSRNLGSPVKKYQRECQTEQEGENG